MQPGAQAERSTRAAHLFRRVLADCLRACGCGQMLAEQFATPVNFHYIGYTVIAKTSPIREGGVVSFGIKQSIKQASNERM